jgi:hypothetical protein
MIDKLVLAFLTLQVVVSGPSSAPQVTPRHHVDLPSSVAMLTDLRDTLVDLLGSFTNFGSISHGEQVNTSEVPKSNMASDLVTDSVFEAKREQRSRGGLFLDTKAMTTSLGGDDDNVAPKSISELSAVAVETCGNPTK